MVDKRDWPKPAAWAITQNENLWRHFDAVADRSTVVEWSLGDNYRTRMMDPGDRVVFWITGRNGGIARLGFVLAVAPSRRGYWKDAFGTRHKSSFFGQFFLPPFPNRRYIHRNALVDKAAMAECELFSPASQSTAPLRLERKEWAVIERELVRFDLTNRDFRAPWQD
jgi:hypothetical protein